MANIVALKHPSLPVTLFPSLNYSFLFHCAADSMSGSAAHKQRYKNVSVDADELRRRREEEGIQLRKQKREEQLSKRRNVTLVNVSDDEMV